MTLTPETFEAVAVGDIIDAAGLFQGVTAQPVKLRAAAREADKIDFVVTYFGVTLGRWTCRKIDGGLTWAF